MATDDRKTDKSAQPSDKQDDKIVDLPSQKKSDKDAQVKGGRMPLKPNV